MICSDNVFSRFTLCSGLYTAENDVNIPRTHTHLSSRQQAAHLKWTLSLLNIRVIVFLHVYVYVEHSHTNTYEYVGIILAASVSFSAKMQLFVVLKSRIYY
jgi:hypothetical protein